MFGWVSQRRRYREWERFNLYCAVPLYEIRRRLGNGSLQERRLWASWFEARGQVPWRYPY